MLGPPSEIHAGLETVKASKQRQKTKDKRPCAMLDRPEAMASATHRRSENESRCSRPRGLGRSRRAASCSAPRRSIFQTPRVLPFLMSSIAAASCGRSRCAGTLSLNTVSQPAAFSASSSDRSCRERGWREAHRRRPTGVPPGRQGGLSRRAWHDRRRGRYRAACDRCCRSPRAGADRRASPTSQPRFRQTTARAVAVAKGKARDRRRLEAPAGAPRGLAHHPGGFQRLQMP